MEKRRKAEDKLARRNQRKEDGPLPLPSADPMQASDPSASDTLDQDATDVPATDR